MSSGTYVGGKVAVIDVARDRLLKRVQVGTGGKEYMPGRGRGSAHGLATDPFWWFER